MVLYIFPSELFIVFHEFSDFALTDLQVIQDYFLITGDEYNQEFFRYKKNFGLITREWYQEGQQYHRPSSDWF